jgi:uncharacterized protein (DUF2147 family)
LALFLWLISASVVLAADDRVSGTWKTADGRALIKIYRCGAKICGRVAWLREACFPADDREGMAGKPRTDRYNPDPEKAQSQGHWSADHGRFYPQRRQSLGTWDHL